MAKRIAVLVRDCQEEALRVALGLTLETDRVEVVVLDCALAETPASADLLRELRDQGLRLTTNCACNPGLELLGDAELARRLAACDAVLAI